MNKQPSSALIIIGSGSRAGRAIAAAACARSVTRIGRFPTTSDVRVSDYIEASPQVIPEGATIVNCAGLVDGNDAALERANVDVPVAWARAAASAGARRFIQLSSFSVYGRVERIGTYTAERPVDAYGRSKLTADLALSALAGDKLSITILRIPSLFGFEGRDKLGSLVTFIAKTKMVPRTLFPFERSMLGYGLLGEVVSWLDTEGIDGIAHAADPLPFSYELIADIARHHQLNPWRIPIPETASRLLGSIAPGLQASLFRSSLLDPKDNLAQMMPTYLEQAVRARFAKAGR